MARRQLYLVVDQLTLTTGKNTYETRVKVSVSGDWGQHGIPTLAEANWVGGGGFSIPLSAGHGNKRVSDIVPGKEYQLLVRAGGHIDGIEKLVAFEVPQPDPPKPKTPEEEANARNKILLEGRQILIGIREADEKLASKNPKQIRLDNMTLDRQIAEEKQLIAQAHHAAEVLHEVKLGCLVVDLTGNEGIYKFLITVTDEHAKLIPHFKGYLLDGPDTKEFETNEFGQATYAASFAESSRYFLVRVGPGETLKWEASLPGPSSPPGTLVTPRPGESQELTNWRREYGIL